MQGNKSELSVDADECIIRYLSQVFFKNSADVRSYES